MRNADATRVIDAKLIMDKVIEANDLHGLLAEVGVDGQDAYEVWMQLDGIVRDEGLSYDVASGSADEVSVEHWSEVDGALQKMRDLVRAVDAGEGGSKVAERVAVIEDKVSKFGIDY